MSSCVSDSEMQNDFGGQEKVTDVTFLYRKGKSFPYTCHTKSLHIAAVGEAAI